MLFLPLKIASSKALPPHLLYRNSIAGPSSLVRRSKERRYKALLGQNEKRSCFLWRRKKKKFRSVLPSKILHTYSIVSMEYLWRIDGLMMEKHKSFGYARYFCFWLTQHFSFLLHRNHNILTPQKINLILHNIF